MAKKLQRLPIEGIQPGFNVFVTDAVFPYTVQEIDADTTPGLWGTFASITDRRYEALGLFGKCFAYFAQPAVSGQPGVAHTPGGPSKPYGRVVYTNNSRPPEWVLLERFWWIPGGSRPVGQEPPPQQVDAKVARHLPR